MLVSVIIPTLNEAANILGVISASRRDYEPNEVEIIVVDGGSQDGTLDLIPTGIPVYHSRRNRGAQMNLGATYARGEILAFCHADSRLPPGWREAVMEVLKDCHVSGGTFQLSILPARGILKLRNRVVYPADWKLMYGDQVHFMSRSSFEKTGGYQEIPIMEDLEMSRSLHQLGQLVRIPLRVTTSSRRYSTTWPIRQWLLNILFVLLYLYFGVTAEKIKAFYERGGPKGH